MGTLSAPFLPNFLEDGVSFSLLLFAFLIISSPYLEDFHGAKHQRITQTHTRKFQILGKFALTILSLSVAPCHPMASKRMASSSTDNSQVLLLKQTGGIHFK